MKYLTYSGNTLVDVDLPDSATVFYAPPPLPGLRVDEVPAALEHAVEHPEGMEPLPELVGKGSKVLILFDDNCQPFPRMERPDIRETMITKLLELLGRYGVDRRDVRLMCAVALHRKMEPHEMRYMVGDALVEEFTPDRLKNFDAEDPDDIVRLGETAHGEPVETSRWVTEADLVIYVDTIQIPLNGGHKSVAVGCGTYDSIAPHHNPAMTEHSPHVMQPEGSHMHGSIERISRKLMEHVRIMVIEAAMNGAIYPPHLAWIGKSPDRLSATERVIRKSTPIAMKALPEPARKKIFHSMKSPYSAIAVNAGSIDAVHPKTLAALKPQLEVIAPRQYDTLVFGLPDLSPYAIGARINPVLVVSDVLGYIFNWFWNEPFVKRGGVVILLNPVFEVFHPRYHAAYKRFWDEVLPETSDPFEMRDGFQEAFARDPFLVDAYRNRFAHHGFHPFTVWYWATYPLRYLSDTILVGPPDDRSAKRLGVSWAPSVDHALGMARELTGGDDVVALTIPPFMYLNVNGGPR
ncbi:MAG TPA: lactate racemase domain-containing protein [Gemmatimonadota bacterium]|nr:lactate racemase domain-containing protein [Gemmatimonadota bacterium]